MTYHLGHRKECPERLELLKPFVSGQVLDVGCSEGFFSISLAEHAVQILAIDNELPLIEHCERQGAPENVTFRHQDVCDLIHQPEIFDTTLYMAVHHHLIADRGMKEADEVLRDLLVMTRGYMIFEMGQKNEKGIENFGWWKALPNVHPEEWIPAKLRHAGANHVEQIGCTTVHNVHRWLWKVSL